MIGRRNACLLAITFALLFVALNEAVAQTYSNKDYCEKSGKVVIFAIDITTPYDETDKNSIISLTDHILTVIRGGDKLIIRTIADSHAHSERLIDRCIPHCAANSALDRLFKCSDGLIRTDMEKVRAELTMALRSRLSTFEELNRSDILRTIHSISSEESSEGHEISLYVYSDLIENSDYFSSQYLFSYSLSRLLFGIEHYKLFSLLKNAEVYVYGVGRAGGKDRRPLNVNELRKLTEFWAAYFKESGAKTVRIGQNVAR